MIFKRPSNQRRPHNFSRRGRSFRNPLARRLRVEQLEDRRMLAIFTVTNSTDAGPGSLRDAIAMANSPAAPGPDEIQFSTSGQINLSSGAIEISEELTITGPGQDLLTIDANLTSRIFNITATTGDFKISGLTVREGQTTGQSQSGGAIRAVSSGTLHLVDVGVSDSRTTGSLASGGGVSTSGDLTVTNSLVKGNSINPLNAGGGGIHADGDVTITNSKVCENSGAEAGGGIFAGGDVTLNSSTVSNNSSSNAGGGIRGFGNVMLINSTVSGNESGNQGGGGISASGAVTLDHSTVSGNSSIRNGDRGGGINASGTVTLDHSTVSGNTAYGDGAGINASDDVTVRHSTITDNHVLRAVNSGGGISIGQAALTIENSIVAGNTAGSNSPDFAGGPFVPLTVRHSLIGDNAGTGMTESQIPDANGNLVGGLVGGIIDAELGPLAFNGGLTETHAPLPGSPVIDRGDPAIAPNPTEFDQRGAPYVRVANGAGGLRIDMGAHELQTVPGVNLVVDILDDEYDGNFGPGDLSLREAISQANGSAGHNTITFDAAVVASSMTIDLELGEMEIADSVTIDGPGQHLLTIDGQQQSRVFHISAPNVDTTINRLTLTGGRTTESGTEGRGGAIWSRIFNSTLRIGDSTITDNSTANDAAHGGAIFAAGDLVVSNSTITGNSTAGSGARGGGISVFRTLSLSGSTVTGNSTAGNFALGGGVYASGNTVVTGSTISGNSTSGDDAEGGGIYSFADVTLIGSTVSGNSTDGEMARGGGVNANGDVTLTRSTVRDNDTEGMEAEGGGIWNRGAVTITGSTVSGNSTTGPGAEGGALRTYFDPLTIINSTISGNFTSGSGSSGGAILAIGSITVDHSTITENHAIHPTAPAGGIWNNNDPIEIRNTILAGNTAGAGFDDIRPGTGSLDVTYSIIGTGVPNSAINNIVSNAPEIGPLANNGGPTLTHAPLPNSHAIGQGDPNFITGITNDQRGAPFLREFGGRIDIGAVENQPIPMSADFEEDGDIDGFDFLLWQRGFGTTYDASDLAAWEAEYPQPLAAAAGSAVDPAALVDAALAMEWLSAVEKEQPAAVVELPEVVAAIIALVDRPDSQIASAESITFSHERSDGSYRGALPWVEDELLERVLG